MRVKFNSVTFFVIYREVIKQCAAALNYLVNNNLAIIGEHKITKYYIVFGIIYGEVLVYTLVKPAT